MGLQKGGPSDTAILVLGAVLTSALLGSCSSGQDGEATAIKLQGKGEIVAVDVAPDKTHGCFLNTDGALSLVDLQSAKTVWTRQIGSDDFGEDYRWHHLRRGHCEFSPSGDSVVGIRRTIGGVVHICPVDPNGEAWTFVAGTLGMGSGKVFSRIREEIMLGMQPEDLKDIDEYSASEKDKHLQFMKRRMERSGLIWGIVRLVSRIPDEEGFRASEHLTQLILKERDRLAGERIATDATLGKELLKTFMDCNAGHSFDTIRFRDHASVVWRDNEGDWYVCSTDDRRILWHFSGKSRCKTLDRQHRYVDEERGRGVLDDHSHWETVATSQVAGSLFLHTIGRGGRWYGIPRWDWVLTGRVRRDGTLEYRSFETTRTGLLAADGYQVMAVYDDGKAVVWDISGDGGKLKRVAQKTVADKGVAIGENIVPGAIEFANGTAVIGVGKEYWVYRDGEFRGPYQVAGKITAVAIRSDWFAYGTEDGHVVFAKLPVE